ncbi:MFS transporter [Arthrobacter yangruifuii]|uniref:MFS transporter n=1 Tax=Arthrobacter yangruifuii TaxID=2606616 RepID=A0A5N6MKA3_9MICC|nr:MFS transporter [Arthrobacter yangruifuii]KAD3633168.1 MFS transporter [Arthrobacter yangruifuii]
MATGQLHHTAEGNPPGRSFRFLASAAAAEGFGDALTRAVLPILAVAVLGLGPAFVGILNATGIAAFLLLGVGVGIAVDRAGKPRAAMGAASLLRCGVLLALAAALWRGGLTGGVLFAAAVLIGVADVVFTTAHSTVVPRVVGQGGLRRAYSRLAVINQTTAAGGAGAAGAILAVIGMPLLLLAGAGAYAASCLFQRGIRLDDVEPRPEAEPVAGSKPGPAGKPGPGGQRRPAAARRRARGGFASLRHSPALRALTLSACLTNAGAMVGNTVLPVYVLRDLAVAPGAFAALGVLSALGAVGGAAAAPYLSGRMGLRALRTGSALLGVPAVLLAVFCSVLPGPETAWLAAQTLVWGFLVAVAGVAGAEVLPRVVPHHELATVGAAQRTLTLGVMPAAAVLAGLAAAAVGTVPVLWLWALLAGAAALPVACTGSLAPFR